MHLFLSSLLFSFSFCACCLRLLNAQCIFCVMRIKSNIQKKRRKNRKQQMINRCWEQILRVSALSARPPVCQVFISLDNSCLFKRRESSAPSASNLFLLHLCGLSCPCLSPFTPLTPHTGVSPPLPPRSIHSHPEPDRPFSCCTVTARRLVIRHYPQDLDANLISP